MFTWDIRNKGQPHPGQLQGDGTNPALLGSEVLFILSLALLKSQSLLIIVGFEETPLSRKGSNPQAHFQRL